MKICQKIGTRLITGGIMVLSCPAFLLAMGAPASGGQAKAGADWGGLVMLAAIFAIFYFLLIRPQQKRTKEHQELLKSLKRGDDVITTGGIFGRIAEIDEGTVMLEVAEKVKIKVARDQIAANRSMDVKAGPGKDEKKGPNQGSSGSFLDKLRGKMGS
ncbi:MAG: preprotein translocase subunit YajC [Proteobacteria bacterium]|nr:preprotein translocase subunit YajC [Pseudomonadota bacterium]